MFDINASNVADHTFKLSDGTVVEFVKFTRRDNIQVRLPIDHHNSDDTLRIFKRDGSHYKDEIDLTLSAELKAPVPVASEQAAVSLAKPISVVQPVSNDKTGQVVVIDGVAYQLEAIGSVLEL